MSLPKSTEHSRGLCGFVAFCQKLAIPHLLYRHVIAGTLAFSLAPISHATAGEFLGAIAALDETDDRPRPAAMLHVGVSPTLFARTYVYGREQGLVKEDTQILSAGYRFPLFSKGAGLNAGIGGTAMREYTKIEAAALEATATEDIETSAYNFGMLFSLNWTPIEGPIFVNVGWDSHVFLAGQAGIVLATGRKQFISLGTGVRW